MENGVSDPRKVKSRLHPVHKTGLHPDLSSILILYSWCFKKKLVPLQKCSLYIPVPPYHIIEDYGPTFIF
jgi:hypothetical protein